MFTPIMLVPNTMPKSVELRSPMTLSTGTNPPGTQNTTTGCRTRAHNRYQAS